MTNDEDALVNWADAVVIARKKAGSAFNSVRLRTDARVFDMAGFDLPLEPDRVVGLYW